jgi:hypothetical protein
MRKLCAGILLFLVFFPFECLRAQEVTEGGVTIRAGRILNGERSGRRFYGYSSVDFVFPERGGGTLSFVVWNDQHRTRPSTTNYLVFVLGNQKYMLESYSTPLDVKEFFAEQQGEWGPGGGSRVRISIAPQLEKLNVNYEGSETGIEISDVRFSGGSTLGRPVEYEQAVNTNPDTYPAFGRTQHGAESHTIFSGYSGGEIALPNRRGGVLSFRFWNDQHRTRPYTLNLLTARMGERYYFFEQYTTPLDLKEFYTETANEWGPAGGSEVRLQVPPGVPRVILSYVSSDTGFEISNVQFSSGATLGREFQYDEAVNWTDRTFNTFGRVLAGQRSGKKFYGYSSASIVLPHRKGGVLRFTAWNDQHRTRPSTRNFLRYAYANVREAVTLLTLMSDLGEFYLEMPNEWGPAGGRTLQLAIPPGISHVEIANDGSDSGIEISDPQFVSRPGQTVIAGPVAGTPYPAPQEPAGPEAEIAPSELATPEVTAVDPPRASPGSQVNLRVGGKNFHRAATLSFLNPGIQVLETRVLSARELTARVHIAADALPGPTSLYVVNPHSRPGEFRFEVLK